jgi:acyl carrier protein
MEKLDTLIQDAVVEHLGIDAEKYSADKTLEEMGADDLDVIGLLMHIEEELNVPQFPDECFQRWSTPQEITDWLNENIFADS